MAKAKVAVLRTSPETVVDDYRKLLELAGADSAMDKNATTILKDNITWHLAFPGVNTTPWQMEGTILGLKDLGFSEIVDVHNHTVVTDPHIGEVNLHFKAVYDKYEIPRKFNFVEEDMHWEIYKPRAKMHVLDHIFPEGIRVPDYFHGKNIVHLPTMKTHTYTQWTGAMKNAFGGLLSQKRHYTHTWIHETLVDLLAIQKEIHSGVFATMDGTTAAEGPGPRTVQPHDKNVIIASADQVAIDAVAGKIMGFDPMQVKFVRMAHDDGLGVGDPREIEIVGDESVLKENWRFQVGANFATGAGLMLWRSPLKVFQNLLFHTPLVHGFVAASAIYHDKVWYPMNGDKVVQNWINTSPWGNLFTQYERAEQIPDRGERA